MAGYRPKSLDELNNLYGKAISAENEIKKSSSLLKEEVLSDIIGGEHGEVQKPQRTVERRETGVSNDIDSFIRQFSNEHGYSSIGETFAKRPAPQPPQPPRADFENRREAFAPSERKSEDEKPGDISGLMDDYVRIMSGEDDDEDDGEFSSRKPLFKNRRNDKKGKKKNSKDIIEDSSGPVQEEQPQEAASEREPVTGEPLFDAFESQDSERQEEVAADSEPVADSEPEVPKKPFTMNIDENAEKAMEQSLDEELEKADDSEYDFDIGSAQASRPSGGVIFAKVVLSVLLAITLIVTVLTGVGVFSVNSERALPGGVLIFCATNAYEDAGIKSNDFIICKKSNSVDDGEKVIYINRELRSFSFGVKNGEKTDINGNVYYKVSSEQVEKTNVLGVIVKTVPSFGKVVRIVVENYLFVLLGLVVLAIILTLVLCLAFRRRNYDDYYYDEDYEDGESSPEEDFSAVEKKIAQHAQDEIEEEDDDRNSLYSGIE